MVFAVLPLPLVGCTESRHTNVERTESPSAVVLTEEDDLSEHVGQRVIFTTEYEGFVDGVGFLDCGRERVAVPYRPIPEPRRGQRITITGKLGVCEGFSPGSKMHNVIIESWEGQSRQDAKHP